MVCVHLLACSHSDVLNDSVLYIQDDLEATSDDLEFDIYDIENTLRRQRAEIVVKARLSRLKTRLRVTDRQPVTIGLDVLDASQLKVTDIYSTLALALPMSATLSAVG